MADSCSGDSGGGLVTTSGGRRFLVGVVSFGETECGLVQGEAARPGVYTNITSHVSWIRGVAEWADRGGPGGAWSAWSDWGGCSAGCGGGERRRARVCGGGAPSGLGHWVSSRHPECPGSGEEVLACNTGPCVPDVMALVPGAKLLGGIVSGLSSIFDPQESSHPPTSQAQDHSCEYNCDGWPFQQCQVETRIKNIHNVFDLYSR